MDFEEEIFEKLHGNGVVTESVLPIFLNDKSYYLEMLNKFLEEDEIEKICQCIQQKDYDSALNEAYSLTAITGSLGLNRAYEASHHLCTGIQRKSQDEIERCVHLIKCSYREIKDLF